MPVQGTGASTARFRDKAQAALRDKAQFSSALDAKVRGRSYRPPASARP